MTIWKFPLEVTDEQIIEMPMPGQSLSVQIQDGIPCLWALVNPGSPRCRVRVQTFGTGNPIDEDSPLGQFVGTYQLQGGSLVFHVFAGRLT